MADILPVNIGEKFASKVLKKFYGKAVAPEITNTDYEPMASTGGADRVHILSFLNSVSLSDYSVGNDMSKETWLGDVEDDLILDQKKYFNFEIDSLNKFEAYVDDLDSNLIADAAGVLQRAIDTYVLGSNTYREVKAGHRVGSDALRGSIKVSAAGAVVATDNSTTLAGPFTAAMGTDYLSISFDSLVGVGTAAATWYRISAYTDSTHVTVTDWNGSTYTGGAKYERSARISAFTANTATSSNIYGYIVNLGTMLSSDDIPPEDRWFVVHPNVGGILRQSTQLIPAVATAYEKVVENGLLGYISGFKVYESTQVAGDNSTGYYCLAGHKSFITFAHSFKESRIIESQLRFAKMYQGLNVWGAKVTIPRRKAGAYMFITV